MVRYDHLVLFIPHSSDRLDRSEWTGDIDAAVDRWTDWHTDMLFRSEDVRVKSIVFPYSRFYCDAERLIDDPMEMVGQGIAYRTIDGCERILTLQQLEEIHAKYDSIHERLEKAAQPGCLIIDCHSFPSDLSSETDICIGFNDDETRPHEDILNTVVEHFASEGYRVGINTPYSNSMRVKEDIPTLMIEVNKRVYLQDDGKTPNEDFCRINRIINDLYSKLLSLKH